MKKCVLLACLSLCLTGCGGEQPKLGAVQNLAFADGILTFDELEGASSYGVSFSHYDELLYEDVISDTSIDTDSLGIKGNIDLKIWGISNEIKGEETSFAFTSLSSFSDIQIEAEDCLLNFGTGKSSSNFRNNPLAHKGAYVGGIDDAGQGIYFDFLSPFDGSFPFYSYYLKDANLAHHDVFINGKKQAQFNYTMNTGWGGDKFSPAEARCDITLKKGWNSISVMKNGSSSDNYGGFAELDWFKIEGNGEQYNIDDLADFGSEVPYRRLEAEMGSPRRKNPGNGLYECKNPAIVASGSQKWSNGFLLGNMDSNYDGVEWQFNSPIKSEYEVHIAYASGEFPGSEKAAPSFVVTQEEIGLSKSVDFEDYPVSTIKDLPYTGWGNVVMAEAVTTITLEKGKNFIYALKMDSASSGIFQLDYVDLVRKDATK